MNCKDFQHWLSTRDAFTDKENPEATNHLKGCKICERLYKIDTRLEKSIKSAFHQQEVPKSLYDRIELTLDRAKKPALLTKFRLTKFSLTGLATFLSLILVAVYMIFFNTPFRYQNLQQLGEKAVFVHLKGNTIMSFNDNKIDQAVTMLSNELKFNVILPDLKDQGYTLLGGRLCALGECKAAYLFFEKKKNLCSLFIMDYDHLGFEMADGSRFSNIIKGCPTDIWKEKGQVYAMVH